MPHGSCILWTPTLVWRDVLANAIIWLSYWGISFTLWRIVRRSRSVKWRLKVALYGFMIFLAFCGTTHLWDVITIYRPWYWSDSWVRIITAGASVTTALCMVYFEPVFVDALNVIRKLGEEVRQAIPTLTGAEAERLTAVSRRLDDLLAKGDGR